MDKVDQDKPTPASSSPTSRRSVLVGAVAGLAGTAGAAALLLPAHPTHAATCNTRDVTPIKDIFSIARTAERLAVTFYTHGVKNAEVLGLSGDGLAAIKAALIEEQIHEQYFASNGGTVLASEFSFPQGNDTFETLSTFIATQQILEGVFDSAFLAAVKEFALQNRPDLAQIAAQIATVEAEHRALGRFIGGLTPADNWAFSPVQVAKVSDAPSLITSAGFLSPKNGNRYTYQPTNISDENVIHRVPSAATCS